MRWREEDLPAHPVDEWSGQVPGSGLVRDRKGWLATVRNVSRALRTAGWWRCIAWDKFREEIVWSPWRGAGRGQWRSWTDEDYTRCRIELEKAGFAPVGRELMRDAVREVAMRREFDSLQLWLGRLKWDGVPRVREFFSKYCGAEPGEYAEALSLYAWTAQAGRALVPGVKADVVPTLVGVGGLLKSTMIARIAPAGEFAGRLSLSAHDTDTGRRLRGKVVIELAELRGLWSRDAESVKDFLSATEDSWVPKYLELARQLPRRVLFWGSTDRWEFLSDESGNLRRWAPIRVGVTGGLDVAALERDREQLWAEAADLFLQMGVAWQGLQTVADRARAEHEIGDSWAEAVLAWAEEPAPEDFYDVREAGGKPQTWAEVGFSTREALTLGLGIELKAITRAMEMRFAGLIRQFDYSRKRGGRGAGRRGMRVWKRESGP